jgi:diacylglycerol kinase (ATP)
MPISCAKVIINPAAGGGSIRKRWPQVCRLLSDAGIPFDCEFTKGVGHAIEIARQAAEAGYPYLIATGGDGTVNEVANGLLSSANPDETILGIVKAGTSCGFIRSLAGAQSQPDSHPFSFNQCKITIDVGMVEYSRDGQRLRRFFVNEASAGIGAAVVNVRKRLPNRLGRNMNYGFYNIAAYSTMAFYRNKNVKICVGEAVEDLRACYAVVANGQYFADGMRIAPHASLDDGLLNVVTIGNVSKTELLGIASKAYGGIHVEQPAVRERKASVISIECEEQFFVEADGEMLGECPASFQVMPSALTVALLDIDAIGCNHERLSIGIGR